MGNRPLWYYLDGKEPRPTADGQPWIRPESDGLTTQVARTEAEGITVSTVFLGLDHQFQVGPPLLFETMIFSGETLPELDEYCERYATWDEAEAGHQRAVAMVGRALNGGPGGVGP